ncbi:MAG: hypothetical protein R2856_27500 [Caldilineaceae bacterium]
MRRKFGQLGEDRIAAHIENRLYSESVTDIGEMVYSHRVDVQYEGRELLHSLFDSQEDDIQIEDIEALPGKAIYEASDRSRIH